MKPTKRKFFKLQNIAIIAFLAMLGFTSCQKEEKKCKCRPEIGDVTYAYGVIHPPCTC